MLAGAVAAGATLFSLPLTLPAGVGEATSIGVFAMFYLAAWLWWSWQMPPWLVWAVESVDDWPQLREKAIASKLIWAESTQLERLFARTAFWTAEQRQRFEAATRTSRA